MGNEATRWRKLPVEIDAVQYVRSGYEVPSNNLRDCFSAWPEWLRDALRSRPFGEGSVGWGYPTISDPLGQDLCVGTKEGPLAAMEGDWIIRGIAGELYPCKPDIFDATYERAMPGDGQTDNVVRGVFDDDDADDGYEPAQDIASLRRAAALAFAVDFVDGTPAEAVNAARVFETYLSGDDHSSGEKNHG